MSEKTTEALEEISGALKKIEVLTQVLAATSSAFEVLLDAIENVRVDAIAAEAEKALQVTA